jgi:hypothetical protein
VIAGQFFEIWPRWAVAGLIAAGLSALVCRMFFPAMSGRLIWLWIAPLVMALPAAALVASRSFRTAEILALADSLGGGHGALLTLSETRDPQWVSALERVSRVPLPQLHPWRHLRWVAPAAIFLAVALSVPQRVSPAPESGVMGRTLVRELETTLAVLKQQELVTPEEEKKLEEEIERIRKGAMNRLDASSWEAADALQEKMSASLGEKQDALKWAEESLIRYAEAAREGALPTEQQADELAKAIQKLAENGMLGGLTPELERLLGGREALVSGKLNIPDDAAARAELMEKLGDMFSKQNGRFAEASKLGRRFERFDPSEFPLESDNGQGGSQSGNPGRGGVTRGRADAELTWGNETQPFDRFKSKALPPGAAWNPDDWTPVVSLPGAPQAAPQNGPSAASRNYAEDAGQAAWRRTLAPRHYSAVKKYFEK